MKKKIAIIASSRATYGYKRKLIGLVHKSKKLKLQLIVTGMHLLKEYGYSLKEIEADGYPITAKVDMAIGGDTPSAWAKSIGTEIQNLAQVFSMIHPDLVLVTGDRAEMFAAAVTAAYMGIPIAHIQAGDVSGHIDGCTRHAITKISHLHLASCEDSAQRVERMGEEPFRIHNVGAPQLDEIIHSEKMSKDQLSEIFHFDFNAPVLLVLQHPVLIESANTRKQMIETMEAVKALKMQTIIVYPNIDAGGEQIIDTINHYQKFNFVKTYRNIERKHFISLLAHISILIGNSSCGILESSSFKLPTINIGNRQRGRMQASNVINVDYNRKEIMSAVYKIFNDADYKNQLNQCVNPYGDGKSSERIVKILEDLKIDEKFIDKRITY